MEYRHLGKSGLRVSEIALGAYHTFGELLGPEETRACIQAAVSCGINFFDNADIYARGEAERAVGQAIRDLGLNRQHLVLSSKVYFPMSSSVNDGGLSRKHIFESVEGSLRRFGTDYLDIYFCHRHDSGTPLEEVVRAMDDLLHQGKVLYWGTSSWSAAQIEAAVGAARALNASAPRAEQVYYTMLTRDIEAEIMPTCASHGIGITIHTPLAGGLLTGKYNDGIPAASRGERDLWSKRDDLEPKLAKIHRLTALAKELDLEMAQLALAWILRRPEVCSVITGATHPEHILSNAAASGERLPPNILDQIGQILSTDSPSTDN